MEEWVGAGIGVAGGPVLGLKGFIKTVVIHPVLQWFVSVVGSKLAHGLWSRVEM